MAVCRSRVALKIRSESQVDMSFMRVHVFMLVLARCPRCAARKQQRERITQPKVLVSAFPYSARRSWTSVVLARTSHTALHILHIHTALLTTATTTIRPKDPHSISQELKQNADIH